MSHQEIIRQLRQLVRRLRWLNFLQLIPDTLVIYGILQLAFNQEAVMLFNTTFSRRQAGLVTILFALIDLCVTGIRYNDRLSGRRLISQLRGHLSEPEAALIKQFERFK
ncbi:hypothetical protein FD30_GL001753 [Levilactobacillus namurensis DSM 19117]|uniref:Uncharacterized protein n=2 Tax=Levilactobacillus namurensis TaxID=380393 RepID=A0A0R1K7R4_9LACO|nr:hypothetical protein [Levilactobacillus namurensis]PTM21604.1 hypothetical protein DA798_09495 [Lactobacillus sp. PFC-70]KRK75938.1 hypothetical protein FD30_GL001753 [Levilactobacillus namurensis DSM 19117]MCW3778851.1 hypothetical protein [Levilactobacillus namurensis]MDT7012910.1 hypothetical protein [Levilactobacillus namurensis]MDT7017854.1 hypothetical protein [Levilactobacillus namurensis]